ncbi:MAG: MlaD family protein [Tepidisphaerales bacterium]
MSNKKRNPLLAGVFIVVSIAGAIGIILGIKGLSWLTNKSEVRYVSFALADDVGGLAIGDDVRIGGYKVGEVLRIELVQPDDPRLAGGILVTSRVPAARPVMQNLKPTEQRLLVSISIPEKYLWRPGVKVSIQSTVTGQSNLNFDTLGAGDPLPKGAILAGRPGTISELLAMLGEVAPKLSGAMGQLNDRTLPAASAAIENLRDHAFPAASQTIERVRDQTVPKINDTLDEFRGTAKTTTATVDKLQGHIDPAMAKYHKVGDSAIAMMDEIRAVFGDTKTDIRTTMANLSSATGSVKDKLPGILDKMDSAMVKVNEVVAGAQEALVDVKKSMENVREATGTLKAIFAGNKGRIDIMIEALKNTGHNLERTTADLRHSPWRLLYQPKEAELSNLTLFDSAREFAIGATSLNDAAQALRDALKEGKADPATVADLLKRLDDEFKKFGDAEKKLWNEVKE